jgi:hypothetical protein
MKEKAVKWGMLTIIVSAVAYSLIGFAYVNKTFVSRDLFEMVCKRLETIDAKLDRLIERTK